MTGQQAPENILSCLNKPQPTQLNKLHSDSSSKSFLQHSLVSLLHLSGEFLRRAPLASMFLAPTVLGRLSSYPVYPLCSWSSEMEATLFTDGEPVPAAESLQQRLAWPGSYGVSIHTRTSNKTVSLPASSLMVY